ncbi:signal peptidase II [Zavarzinia compransoris]|uniref:signal peptidase II n=1 Tax=Zavarzinia marina TaxID=2911065 RepID=UPI001F2C942F|nr:signal peptidase II [Zavarzinia marina]MCF4164727.1 signal peptidase II [Zavarzinia marina]
MPDRAIKRFRLLGVVLFVVTLVADRISKERLIALLDGQDPVQVTDFFNLVMVWNRGVSFGLFQQGDDSGRYLLTGFAVLVALMLLVWMWRSSSRLAAAGLALVAGGALGNAYDRVVLGAVADFFDFHVSGYHFWAFNIADSAITVGVGLLLLDAILGQSTSAGSNARPAPEER